MEGRAELVFTDWDQWQIYQKRHPRWQKTHYPLELSLRWGVSRAAIYFALDKGRLVAARVTGPMGEKRIVIPDYSVLEYEKNHLGRFQGSSA